MRRDRHLATQPGLNTRLREHARSLGFAAIGSTRLRSSEHADFYRDWIAAGHHGDMHYLARPDAVERRIDPRKTHPDLRTAIVVAHLYATTDVDDDDADPARAIIARYARGRDYHRVLRTALLRLLRALEDELGRELPLARAAEVTIRKAMEEMVQLNAAHRFSYDREALIRMLDEMLARIRLRLPDAGPRGPASADTTSVRTSFRSPTERG